MTVAAIMPCLGRPEQTVRNVERLLATAGDVQWSLFTVVDADPDVCAALRAAGQYPYCTETRYGYWNALQVATAATSKPLLCNLANALWACDGWLATAVDRSRARFGDGPGLLGFAGDGHGLGHSCHFLIARALLERYGGWPVWYAHNFGDAELCTRARQDGLYWKSFTAHLEHCHVERGLAEDDAVYQAGRATYRQDEALFVERRRLGWPPVSR